MTDQTLPIRAELLRSLKANQEMLGLATIAQHMPERAPYPRLEIDQFLSLPDETKGQADTAQNYNLHIWSKKDGDAEAWGIISKLRSLLNRTTLTLQDGITVHCQTGNAEMFPDPHADDSLYHGVLALVIEP